MPLKTSGLKQQKRRLASIGKRAVSQFELANKENAELIVDTAKALVPVATGTSRALIRNIDGPEGSQIVDFGPISRILEGGTEERVSKTGKKSGKGPALPFKNPAMDATKTKRYARNRKAVRDAIKLSKSG